MSPLTLWEKLQVTWEVITSTPLYGFILAIILFLIYLFITTNSSNKKESKKTYLLIYAAVAIFLGIQYGSSIGSLVDYALNQVFITYYFPNIVIYLLTFITTNIILWKTLFSDKLSKNIKVLTSIVSGTIIYLFILIVSLLAKLKLNAFNLEELYSSEQMRSLLEISMFIFIAWIAVLVIYHLIKKYQIKQNIIKIEEVTNYEVLDNFKLETATVAPKKPVFFPEQLEEKQQIVIEKEPFTLEEYKMMAKILKEEKEKDKNPLSELNALYRSIED